FTNGSASMSVIRAPNSTTVEGTNMLIGGLLEPIVDRPGWGRSMLNRVTLASLAASLAWTSYVGFAMFFPPFCVSHLFFRYLVEAKTGEPSYPHSPVAMCIQVQSSPRSSYAP